MAMSTYQQIAKIAGVSISTVSKALSGNAEISEETRKTIFVIAEKTGYFEKRSKRRLSYIKERAMKIMIIYPEIFSATLLNEVNALIKTVRARKAEPFLYCTDKRNLTEVVNGFISEGAADGFIVKGLNETENFSLPVISISPGRERVPYSSVEVADSGVMICDVINYFKFKGYTKIGYAGNADEDFKKEFLSSMRKCKMKIQKQFIYEENGSNTECAGYIANYICRQEEKPNALFVPSYEIAKVLVNKLKIYNINVPGDIEVVTTGTDNLSKYDRIPMPSVCFNYSRMAEEAVKQLCREINGKNQEHIHHICKHQLEE